MGPTDKQFRQQAKEQYEEEGVLEIEIGATVSREEDRDSDGAYVQAWIWVDVHDIPGFQ